MRVSIRERGRNRRGGRERERACERERERERVCVRNGTVVPGFGLREHAFLQEQVLPAELPRSVIH